MGFFDMVVSWIELWRNGTAPSGGSAWDRGFRFAGALDRNGGGKELAEPLDARGGSRKHGSDNGPRRHAEQLHGGLQRRRVRLCVERVGGRKQPGVKRIG